MLKTTVQNVTITLMLETRVELAETKTYSVKYRLSHKGIKKYITTGKYLTLEEWNDLFISRKRKLVDAKEEIQAGFDRIVEIVRNIFIQKKTFSYELFEQLYGNRKITTIQALFENKISELKEEDREGTALVYSDAIKSFNKFSENKILFPNKIDVSFLKKYEKWMVDQGNSYSTIGIYERHLRAIMNIALKNEMISLEEYPFGRDKYQIPKVKFQKKTLSKDQIWGIIAKEAIKGEKTRMYRDLWVFTYLAKGMNTADICRLKYSDIESDEFKFTRKKSMRTAKVKKQIKVPLIPQVTEIIERWGNKDKSGYIFPFFYKKNHSDSEEKAITSALYHSINQTVTRIGKKHGLGTITVYTARHSFASVKVKNNTNIAELQEDFGHTNISSTAVYFPTTTKEERFESAKKLI